MDGKLFLHVFLGSRFPNDQPGGTCGGSRGDFTMGVLRGEAMLGFIPLHLNASERSRSIEQWMLNWFNDGDAEVLEPKGWFHKAHKTGNWIWAPPPAAAEVAVEQLCESRHARPWNAHLFVCPVLMTSYWQKMLSKVADCMLSIPPGFSHWSANMHEPLVVAIMCLIAPTSPWGAGIVCANIGYPRSNLADCHGAWHGNCYAQLKADRCFPVLTPADLVDEIISVSVSEGQRSPDVPTFQCDLCHFINVKKRPLAGLPADDIPIFLQNFQCLKKFVNGQSPVWNPNLSHTPVCSLREPFKPIRVSRTIGKNYAGTICTCCGQVHTPGSGVGKVGKVGPHVPHCLVLDSFGVPAWIQRPQQMVCCHLHPKISAIGNWPLFV
eukprot:scaffold377919_cov55-Attheya_sp.AAC.5